MKRDSLLTNRILIAEDDLPLAHVLSRKIEQIGYTSVVAHDGKKALSELMNSDFAVVLMDIGLPGLDGLSIVQTIRNQGFTTPFIVITTKNTTDTAIQSFHGGANLFHPKPINYDLLTSQIRMLAKQHIGEKVIELNGVVLDPPARKFVINGTVIPTTYKEFELLRLLISNPDRTFAREEILRRTAKGRRDIEIGSIDTLISRLRRKLENYQGMIETVHGVGFRYRPLNDD